MYKKIASNTIAQIISKILTAIISIFLIGILTKTLPVELYGSYNKVFSYLGIFAFLADLWLYTIAIREISKGKERKEKIIWNILTLRIFLWIIIWILAVLVALVLPWYHDLYTFSAIIVVGAFTLISLINSALLALMQSQMKMEFSLFSVVFWKIINLALIAYFLLIFFVNNTSSFSAFLSIFLIATCAVLINTILNYYYAKKICHIGLLFDIQYIKKIFRMSLPFGFALFLSVVYFKVDVILLSLLESPEQADTSIALYGLSMKIVEVLMVLGWFYLNSMLPALSAAFEKHETQRLSSLFWASLKILWSLGIFICLMWYIFKTEIISLIATQDYIMPTQGIYSSVDVLWVVFFVLFFHFLALCCIYILIASEKQSLLLKINIAISVLNIIGNIIFIPYFSFYGAAIVTLCSQILLFIVTFFIIWKIVKIPWKYIIQLWKSLFLAGIIYLCFSEYFVYTSYSPLQKIFIFGPTIFIIYWGIELLFSYKLFSKA